MIRVRKRTLRVVEFLIVGVLFGLIEDILAVEAVAHIQITPRVILIILAVAVPFAVLSELIVDHPRFWELLRFKRVDKDGDPSTPI
ncbi:MAG: hypothetical protein Q7R91_02680 [bacterium]|nr:hypothetical protein [bacterium]